MSKCFSMVIQKKTNYPETKAYNRDTSGLEILLRIYPPAGSHQQDDSEQVYVWESQLFFPKKDPIFGIATVVLAYRLFP